VYVPTNNKAWGGGGFMGHEGGSRGSEGKDGKDGKLEKLEKLEKTCIRPASSRFLSAAANMMAGAAGVLRLLLTTSPLNLLTRRASPRKSDQGRSLRQQGCYKAVHCSSRQDPVKQKSRCAQFQTINYCNRLDYFSKFGLRLNLLSWSCRSRMAGLMR
jgi:hypothetical protein